MSIRTLTASILGGAKRWSLSLFRGVGRCISAVYGFLQSVLLPVGAILALAESLYLAWIDRLGGAGIAAALFVLIFLFKHFPQLESIKGLGIEAKLRQRLKEADEIIENIRKLSLVSAQQSYLQLAWMNRQGSPSTAEKNALSGRFQELLRHLDIPETEIDEAKRPLIAMHIYDVWVHVYSVVADRIHHRMSLLTKERQALAPFGSPIQAGSPEYVRAVQIDEETWRLRDVLNFDGNSVLKDVVDLDRDQFRGFVKRVDLGPEETPILLGYATKALAIARSIKKAGEMTDEAEAFIGKDRQARIAQVNTELFGE